MDQFKHQNQNIQTRSQFSNTHYLKKAIQFILTLSLMSFIISYPSSPLPFLLHSFNVYFSSFSMQLINSYNIDRKYMFLLCNGILVFIVKSSGLIGNFQPGTDRYDEPIKNNGDSSQQLIISKEPIKNNGDSSQQLIISKVSKAKASVAGGVVMEIEAELGIDDGLILLTKDQDKEHGNYGVLITKEEEGEEKEEGEEEEGGTAGLLSLEELNTKCDEFIKMMKERIKTEAQQLILVYN